GEAENLRSATTYYVKVRAYKKSGSKVTYGSFSDTIKTSTDPDEVKSLKATAVKDGKSVLSWKKVSGAEGYQIYQYTSGKWSKLITTSNISYTVSNAKSGDRFKVRAYLKLDGKVYFGDFESVTLRSASSEKSSTPSKPDQKITKSEAKSIAVKHSKVASSSVKDYECEYEYSKRFGCYVYEIEFESGKYEYDYIINASNGKILYNHKERS
ncbi:MAG: PepSY domain-containing protein, partial [Acutalibacteraceae bacterium]